MLQPWPEGSSWLAVHLFFHHANIYSGECAEVVMELVLPFVRRCQQEGWTDGHFFIRYSEHGPHVRLRLHGPDSVLEGTVWPALREHVAARCPGVSFEKPDRPQYGPPEEVPEGTPLTVTHAARIEYEPETERYGGELAIRVAERYFEVSSEAADALLLRTSRTERSSRLGKGLLTMVQLVHVFTGGDREA